MSLRRLKDHQRILRSDRITRLCYASRERMFDEQEASMAYNGDQLMLPLEETVPARPDKIGPSSVEYSPARSILTGDISNGDLVKAVNAANALPEGPQRDEALQKARANAPAGPQRVFVGKNAD